MYINCKYKIPPGISSIDRCHHYIHNYIASCEVENVTYCNRFSR